MGSISLEKKTDEEIYCIKMLLIVKKLIIQTSGNFLVLLYIGYKYFQY